MRMARYKVEGSGVYYVRSELVDRLPALGEEDCRVLLAMMGKVAEFCGVVVLEAVALERGMQLVVEANPEKRAELSDEEIVRRYRVLYGEGPGSLGYGAGRLAEVLAEGDLRSRQVRRRLVARMEDLSEYLKALKQRYTTWFNRHHDCSGTIWKGRFASSLLEERPDVLDYYRAFVRTAPVRAGSAARPEDWPWQRSLSAEEARAHLPSAWAERLRPLRRALFDLLATGLTPTVNLDVHARRSEWWDFVEQLDRGMIVGSEEFVAHHCRRWRGYDSSVPLRTLADDARARLCTARPLRRRRRFR